MTHARNADTRLMAMREAHRRGHAEVALMILTGTVRAYIRSPKSKPGWQLHWDKAIPEGTAGVVWVDTYDGRPKFYVTSINEARQLVAEAKGTPSPRPVKPDADHCCITRDQLADYATSLGSAMWEFYTRA